MSQARWFAVALLLAALAGYLWYRWAVGGATEGPLLVLVTGAPHAREASCASDAAPLLLPGELGITECTTCDFSRVAPLRVQPVAPEGNEMRDGLKWVAETSAADLRPGLLYTGAMLSSHEGAVREQVLDSFWGTDSYSVGQLQYQGEPLVWVLTYLEGGGERCLCSCSVYRVRTGRRIEPLITVEYAGMLFFNAPEVMVVPPTNNEPPAILIGQFPLRFACWRWRDDTYRVSLPGMRELPYAGEMMLRDGVNALLSWLCIITAVGLVVVAWRRRARRRPIA